MKKMIITVWIFLALTSGAIAGAENALQTTSAWTNQSGSTLYITGVGGNGQLTGSYINRASGFNCQNIPYPVTGWVYGTAITFTTIWQNPAESCNSITSWTGFYYNGKIHTLWQLAINGSTSVSQILQGSDTFIQSSSMSQKSLQAK